MVNLQLRGMGPLCRGIDPREREREKRGERRERKGGRVKGREAEKVDSREAGSEKELRV